MKRIMLAGAIAISIMACNDVTKNTTTDASVAPDASEEAVVDDSSLLATTCESATIPVLASASATISAPIIASSVPSNGVPAPKSSAIVK